MIMFNNYAELLENKNLIILIDPNDFLEILDPWQSLGMIGKTLLEVFKIDEKKICEFGDDLCGTGEAGFVISPVVAFENEMFELSLNFPEYTFTVLAMCITGEYLTANQFKNGRIYTVCGVHAPFYNIIEELKEKADEKKEWLTAEEYFSCK